MRINTISQMSQAAFINCSSVSANKRDFAVHLLRGKNPFSNQLVLPLTTAIIALLVKIFGPKEVTLEPFVTLSASSVMHSA